MEKPKPDCAYDWRVLKQWLEAEAPPQVARETIEFFDGVVDTLRTLHFVFLDEYENEACKEDLSPETIAWLRAEIGSEFGLYSWR